MTLANKIITSGYGDIPEGSNSTRIIVSGFSGAVVTGEILGSSAQVENVKRSLDKYIWDNLYTTEGIAVNFRGVPFDNTSVIEWVTPRFSINREYAAWASKTKYGYDNKIILNITSNVKRSGATISDKHYLLADTIASYFKVGKVIDLKDWVGGSDGTYICGMKVRETLQDFALPETNELLSYRIVFELSYTEETNKAD